eukprot:770935_1
MIHVPRCDNKKNVWQKGMIIEALDSYCVDHIIETMESASSNTQFMTEFIQTIADVAAVNREYSNILLQNNILSALKPFCQPATTNTLLLQSVVKALRSLCKYDLELDDQLLLDELSVLIHHQDEVIFTNTCAAYNALICPEKWNEMVYPHSFGINYVMHSGVDKQTIMKEYTHKQQIDELVFDASIRRWQSELGVQMPNVIVDQCRQYFMMFDAQLIDDMEYPGILKRLVNEIGCSSCDIQQIVLKTLANICRFGTDCMIDDAITYRMLIRLKKTQFWSHSNDNLRALSYGVISGVLRSSNGLACVIETELITPVMKSLISYDICNAYGQDAEEQKYLFDMFVNAINCSPYVDRKVLIECGIQRAVFKVFLMTPSRERFHSDYSMALYRILFGHDRCDVSIDDIIMECSECIQNMKKTEMACTKLVELMMMIKVHLFTRCNMNLSFRTLNKCEDFTELFALYLHTCSDRISIQNE